MPVLEIDSPVSSVASIIDSLGEIKARIADLEASEKALRDALVAALPVNPANPKASSEGALFRATLSYSERETLDKEAMRAKLVELGVSRQWFTAHTNSTPSVAVRVVARNGK